MIYRINCSTGFTLLEIMVSLCLLSVILLSIITVFPTGIEAIKMSKNVTIACNIASKHLDQYKSQFYLLPDVETLGGIELYGKDHFSIDDTINMEGTTFTPTVIVKQIQFGSDPPVDPKKMLDVIVTVYWRQSSGIKKVRLNSYIFNKTYLPSNVPVY